MRELGAYLREEELLVAVETSEERSDAVATIEAIITFMPVPGTVVGLVELAVKTGARQAADAFATAPGRPARPQVMPGRVAQQGRSRRANLRSVPNAFRDRAS
jgi:hypothetical protein